MRKLKSTDLFAALRVVKAIGVKDEIVALADSLKNRTDKKTQEEIGTALVLGVLSNCGTKEAEDAFYAFFAPPTEKTEDELRDMDLLDFAELVKGFVITTDLEAWKRFFKSLAGVLKNL